MTFVVAMLATSSSEERAVELFSDVRSARFAPCLGEAVVGPGGSTFEPLTTENLGPETAGFRLSVPAGGQFPVAGTMDLIVKRTGRGLAVLFFTGLGQPYPPERRQAVVALLSERMASEFLVAQ